MAQVLELKTKQQAHQSAIDNDLARRVYESALRNFEFLTSGSPERRSKLEDAIAHYEMKVLSGQKH